MTQSTLERENLKRLFDSTVDAMAIADREAPTRLANPPTRRIVGRQPEDPCDQSAAWLTDHARP